MCQHKLVGAELQCNKRRVAVGIVMAKQVHITVSCGTSRRHGVQLIAEHQLVHAVADAAGSCSRALAGKQLLSTPHATPVVTATAHTGMATAAQMPNVNATHAMPAAHAAPPAAINGTPAEEHSGSAALAGVTAESSPDGVVKFSARSLLTIGGRVTTNWHVMTPRMSPLSGNVAWGVIA